MSHLRLPIPFLLYPNSNVGIKAKLYHRKRNEAKGKNELVETKQGEEFADIYLPADPTDLPFKEEVM